MCVHTYYTYHPGCMHVCLARVHTHSTFTHSVRLPYLSCCSVVLLGCIVLSTDPPWLPFPLKRATEIPTTFLGHLQDSGPKIQTSLLQLSIQESADTLIYTHLTSLTFVLNKVHYRSYILKRHQLYVFIHLVCPLSKS